MLRRGLWLTLGVVGVGGAVWLFGARSPRHGPVLTELGEPPRAPSASSEAPSVTAPDDDRAHGFRTPTGDPPSLTCEAARRIVAQVRRSLAYAPDPIAPHAFAVAASDWMDPYGLWSVAPDAPVVQALERRAPALVADLEGRGTPDCAAARDVARVTSSWVRDLGVVFDRSRALPPQEAIFALHEPAFEGTSISRPARTFVALLGQRVGAAEIAEGGALVRYAETARGRYVPDLDEEAWTRIVLAAAVRSYVPLVDPHGAWAPLDEEASVFDVDLEAHPPTRLWDRSSRTAVGLRIESGAVPPLANGDVILALAGVHTAALPVEQIEQLGYAAGEAKVPAEAIVLREGEASPRTLTLRSLPGEPRPPSPAAPDDIPVERIAYGSGDALIVPVHDVRDDLGDALTRALLHEREREGRPLVGVVLDLRSNGGGSTDGALDALGIFLPGAPLFPMRRRDGAIETDRAPEPPSVDRWTGPVATIVDGDTASAAEMMAGALSSYRRGPSVGMPTFGKGCAQEYVEDDAHAGVLRLTTLLFALPDGSPVQRVGLSPTIRLSLTPLPGTNSHDREALLAHAAPTWRGPDVRDRAVLTRLDDGAWNVAWPTHGNAVGPCKDADVCRVLRALGGQSAPIKRVANAKKD